MDIQKYSVNQHLIETLLAWVKSGEIAINTTKGPRKALTFNLCASEVFTDNPADKYR